MIERKRTFRFLIVPGLGGSGNGHWQSLWLNLLQGAEIVPQLSWDRPDLSLWLRQLQTHVERRPGSILIGHSLGSILIAHLAQKAPYLNIAGAMLVAPADVETSKDLPACTAGFAPIPRKRLPFPTSLVSSSDDPYVSIERAQMLARSWGSQFHNAGSRGHINLAAGFGPWPEGERILDTLCEQVAFENRSSRRSLRRMARSA